MRIRQTNTLYINDIQNTNQQKYALSIVKAHNTKKKVRLIGILKYYFLWISDPILSSA